jgi:hypothetical protein
MTINQSEIVFPKYSSTRFFILIKNDTKLFASREETNTSNLLSFLEETEGVLQRLLTHDKQLKEIEMNVR